MLTCALFGAADMARAAQSQVADQTLIRDDTHGADAAAPQWRVHGALDEDGSWTLRWCKSGAQGTALRLHADDVLAMQLLQRVQPAPDQRGRSSLLWHALPDDCIQLHYDLREIAERKRSGIGYRFGTDLLSWSWTWWWRPSNARTDPIKLQIELPAGWHASAPWPSCGDLCWEIGSTPPQWPALLVLGQFEVVRSSVPGGDIEAVLLGAPDPAQARRLAQLAPTAAAQIQSAYGRLPVPQLQVLLLPAANAGTRSDAAVFFGQLLRGGYGGVSLWVNPDASAADLQEHWILPHELGHLLHPHLGEGRGRWLAEGLASYYQQLLRARAGQLSADGAWEQLLHGFARGLADVHPLPLDELAADLGKRRAYMRVYWSGAAFWLLADLQLRTQRSSLDAVLDGFGRAHLPTTRSWDPDRFLRELDAGLPTPIFAPLAEQIGSSTDFPDVQSALQRLDLRAPWSADDPVPTTGSAAQTRLRAAELRAQIMRGRAASALPQ